MAGEKVGGHGIRIERINLEIEGDSPLIVHAWSAKLEKMLDKQMKKAKTAKRAKTQSAITKAFYRLEGGAPGFLLSL